MTNIDKFCEVWTVKLAAAIEKNPEEYLLKDAGAIVARMRKSLPTGGFNLSPTLKAAAKEIGIKPNMAAIMAYCRE